MGKRSIVVAAAVAVPALALSACTRNKETTNQELYSAFESNEYGEDMVEAHPEKEQHASQGESVSPRVMANIEDTIRSVYITDFERCLEKEMERLETRFLGGKFEVQFTIETSGKVSDIKMLSMQVGETKTKNKAAPREADQFDECVLVSLKEWEFDPPPEVIYTHTYQGKVGEAW